MSQDFDTFFVPYVPVKVSAATNQQPICDLFCLFCCPLAKLRQFIAQLMVKLDAAELLQGRSNALGQTAILSCVTSLFVIYYHGVLWLSSIQL